VFLRRSKNVVVCAGASGSGERLTTGRLDVDQDSVEAARLHSPMLRHRAAE